MSVTDAISVRARWMGVAMLFALYTLHSVDRYVIAVIIEPLRHAFDMSDTELGAVGGLAHALAYSAFVLPVGWLMDRTSRVKLLAFMLGIWSAMTAIGALATGFWFLFIMRMGVGAAETASSPGAQSLVASLFPLKNRASAMGVVFSGTAVGTGLVFAVGGPVAANWGWRAVFLMAGIPGILLALLMWRYMPEPSRNAHGGAVDAPVPMRRVALLFLKTPPLIWVSMGSTIAAMNVASIWVWITPILIRQHSVSLAKAGLIVGIAAGVLKFASGFLSGFLSDWIAKGRVNRLWIVPSAAMTLCAPISLGIALSPSPTVAVILVMCLGLCLGTHYAAPKTVIMTVAPDNVRGSVAAIEQLMVNLIGVAVGPFITGIVSDRLGGANAVGLALAATVSVNLIAALCYWQGIRKLDSSSINKLEGEAGAKMAPVTS
jgi:predicted MFS family arabinose efflux permease